MRYQRRWPSCQRAQRAMSLQGRHMCVVVVGSALGVDSRWHAFSISPREQRVEKCCRKPVARWSTPAGHAITLQRAWKPWLLFAGLVIKVMDEHTGLVKTAAAPSLPEARVDPIDNWTCLRWNWREVRRGARRTGRWWRGWRWFWRLRQRRRRWPRQGRGWRWWIWCRWQRRWGGHRGGCVVRRKIILIILHEQDGGSYAESNEQEPGCNEACVAMLAMSLSMLAPDALISVLRMRP